MANVINKAVDLGCKVLTSSVDFSESIVNYDELADSIQAVQAALKNAKDNNVTVCSAAGDAGSGVRVANHATAGPDNQVHLGFMSIQPEVVSCGGTEIRNIDGIPTETTWNNSDLRDQKEIICYLQRLNFLNCIISIVRIAMIISILTGKLAVIQLRKFPTCAGGFSKTSAVSS